MTSSLPPALPGRRRSLIAVVALVVAVLALGGVGFLLWRSETRADDLERKLEVLHDSLDDVEVAFDEDLGEVETRLQAISSDLDGLSSAAGGDIEFLASDVDALRSDLDLVYGELETTRDCINAYTDVIADWGGQGFYEYFYC